MKNIFYIISAVLLLISCNNKSKVDMTEYEKVTIDSVNVLLNDISISLEKKISNYRDSLLNTVDINTFSDTTYIKSLCDNPDNLISLLQAINNNNIEEYIYYFDRRPCANRNSINVDYTPYALYMASHNDNGHIYSTVFQSLFSIDYNKKEKVELIETDISLKEINESQKDLALYYLIKSHQKGYIGSSVILADYFTQGVISYFPKSPYIVYRLQSYYYNKRGEDYYPGKRGIVE